ncbi:MAG: hypothetical protein ACI959_000927 [Limisphaerales bacterium]|jgi:hypothetical protein
MITLGKITARNLNTIRVQERENILLVAPHSKNWIKPKGSTRYDPKIWGTFRSHNSLKKDDWPCADVDWSPIISVQEHKIIRKVGKWANHSEAIVRRLTRAYN